MKDFILFKKMVTPIIVQIFFWGGLLYCMVMGMMTMAAGGGMRDGSGKVFWGFGLLLAGPLVVRMACEMVLMLYKIFENFSGLNQPAAAAADVSAKDDPSAEKSAAPAKKPAVLPRLIVARNFPVTKPAGNGSGAASEAAAENESDKNREAPAGSGQGNGKT
ncbi:MAG: DUF4282 domain-containing protein [Candidatus Omnitrophica bacterium]|nr:DUF4282 domain-containing protein [Candidatus Omnitrophota bacterium]